MVPPAVVACMFLLGTTPPALAGSTRHQAMASVSALLAGHWHGRAWVELEPGRRDEMDLAIVVQPKSDGSALLLDVTFSLDRQPTAGLPALHNEIAVLHFDEQEQAYRFEIFFSSGRHEVGAGRLEGAVLTFVSSTREGGRRRFTLDRSRGDEWRETAEIAADGVHWRTYYDSRIQRVASPDPCPAVSQSR